MDNKTSSIAVIVIGALVLLASLTADFTGLGDDAGFGMQQTTGTIAGVIVLAIGAYLHKKAGSGTESGSEDSPTE